MAIGSPLDLAVRNVRAATVVAPARPAYAAGLRAALATVVPLSVAPLFGPGAGTWMSLAGFTGALADKGGSYGTRAAAIASLAFFGAIAAFIGAIGVHHLAIAVALTFAVGVVCSLGRAWGNTGASVGGSVLNIFVISLAYPGQGLADATGRAGFVLLGGAWAALLSLVLWPVRPYRPARLAVSACFRTLASYVADVVDRMESASPSGEESFPAGSVAVRAALEQARATLATIRRGRPGESGRGERLLVLRETADRLFGNLIALVETIDAIPPAARDPDRQRLLVSALREVINVLRALADRVEEEHASDTVVVAVNGSALRASLTSQLSPAGALPAEAELAAANYAHAAALLDRIAQFATVASANAAALGGRHAVVPTPIPEAEELEERQPLLAPLRSVLGHDSLVLRHALRVGLVVAIAVWLTGTIGLTRGYWVTITVVLILQPYTGATTARAVQRVLGTVLGGILTAALGAVFHDARAILVLAFVFSAVSVALLPLNYAAFSVFLTPTFVLLAEASAGDWHLAGVRVVDTLLGGGLALLGARLLWPAPEWARLSVFLANALRANETYLRTVVDAFADRSETASRLMRARRRDAALAAINAEESFQRLLGESAISVQALAPVMTLLTYVRRFSVSVAALAVSRHAVDPATAKLLARFAERAGAALEVAAARVSGQGVAASSVVRPAVAEPAVVASSAVEPVPVEPVPVEPVPVAPATDAPSFGADTGELVSALVADAASHDLVVRALLTRLARQLETIVKTADAVARLDVAGDGAART